MSSNNSLNDIAFGSDLIIQALASSPAPTAIYSGENMIIQFANVGMLSLWGKDSSVIGKPLMEAIPELEGQPFLDLLLEVWHSGKTYSVTEAPATLIINGEKVLDYFDYEYRALTDKNKKTWCILNTALNVTARREFLKQLEEKEKIEHDLKEEMAATLQELTTSNEEITRSIKELDYRREYIKTIIEQAPVGIAMLKGHDHIIEIANPAILNIWGRNESEVLNLPHAQARPELTGQPVNAWIKEVYETGKPKVNKEFTVFLRSSDGLREAIVNSIYQPIFSEEGNISGILIILEEITLQVLERRKNEYDQQMFALAIDAGELATFYYEPSTNLFSGNTLLKNWFGLSSEEHVDLSIAIATIVPEDRERVMEAISHSLSNNSDGYYFIEYQIQNTTDRKVRLLQARGRVFYDSTGKPLSLNGALRDITEQKKEEQRKDDFMGMVSHELKTPLTSLKAYIQLLQRTETTDQNSKQKIMLEKSVKQIDYMNNLINGFLNVSRLDSGQMHIDKAVFDIHLLFTEIQHEMSAINQNRDFIFKSSERTFINADRNKISQVLHNLIGNSVKYSPIKTTVTVEAIVIDHENLEISVSDQGIGISEEDQSRIFERYYRVKDVQTRTVSGFGIGLYLCKEIIELHHGMIKVESSQNVGTKFSITIPLNEN